MTTLHADSITSLALLFDRKVKEVGVCISFLSLCVCVCTLH